MFPDEQASERIGLLLCPSIDWRRRHKAVAALVGSASKKEQGLIGLLRAREIRWP